MSRKASVTTDAKINVKVFVRVRPINENEKERGSTSIVRADPASVHCKSKSYGQFDQVFGTSSSQRDIFDSVVAPAVDRVLAGFNCTVFAYGQTGTGKTFTMEGGRSDAKSSESDPTTGMTPRAVEAIFQQLEKSGIEEFTVRVSYVELYNEELFDLLAANTDDRERLRLYDNPSKKGAVMISGVEEIPVRTRKEVYDLLERGAERRVTTATKMNSQSSRSHSIFSVNVVMRENSNTGEELVKTGKLNLVDLAGSEHIGRSGAGGKQAKEAGNINQSLLTLGRVITALTSGAPHVPYRESKLTRMLQDSLGGSTITSIIATVSPSSCNFEETVSTLEYAMRAKSIKNHPECNLKVSRKAMLKEYNAEIEKLRRDLRTAREKAGGIYLSQESYDGMEREKQDLEKNVLELTDQLEIKIAELQKFMENMSMMDEQYEAVFNLNKRFRSKLEDRVSELDATKEQLTVAEHKLECYSSSLTQIHRTAKAIFRELAITRETLRSERRDAEKYWAAEEELDGVINKNETNCFATIKTVRQLLSPCEEKLDQMLEATKAGAEKLDTCMETASVSSREDIQVVRGQLQAISHHMQGLEQNYTKLVQNGLDKMAANIADAEERVLKQINELSSTTDTVTDALLQLSGAIEASRSSICAANETLQAELKQSVADDRESLEKEKKLREEWNQKTTEQNAAFKAGIQELAQQLMVLSQEKEKSDEERQASLLSINMASFDSRCKIQDTLPTVAQSFDDALGDDSEKIRLSNEELETKIKANKEETGVKAKEIETIVGNCPSTHKTHADEYQKASDAMLKESCTSVMTGATLAGDACNRADLTMEDTVQDVRAILNTQVEDIEKATETASSSCGSIKEQLTSLAENWRKRSSDESLPKKEHYPLDMDVFTQPPPKKEKLLEQNGVCDTVKRTTRTRESLLDVQNIPMSPGSLAKKRTVQMDAIDEENMSHNITDDA